MQNMQLKIKRNILLTVMILCLILTSCRNRNTDKITSDLQETESGMSSSNLQEAESGLSASDLYDTESGLSVSDSQENVSASDIGLGTDALKSNDIQVDTSSTGADADNTKADTSSNGADADSIKADTSSDSNEQVRIIMAGDMLLHTRVTNSGKMEDGTFNYDYVFEYTRDRIASADIAIANEEVILGGSELGLSGYPAFNGPTEFGDALVEAGFDVILHATNHALDKGKKGLISCLDFWKTTYPEIDVIGIYHSEEASEVQYITEKNEIKIAILNYTYGTNGIALPADMTYAVNLLEENKVREDIKNAKAAADFVIVCPHWGTEYLHGISAEQKKWTNIFMEEKVDLVLGTHPHVIEPVEWIEDEEGNRMLVYYSIGNFVNATEGDGAGVADRMLGALADVTIERDAAGDVVVADYGVVPIVSQLIDEPGGITVYPLEEYTEELAGKNQIIAQDPAFSLQYLQTICEEVFTGMELQGE